ATTDRLSRDHRYGISLGRLGEGAPTARCAAFTKPLASASSRSPQSDERGEDEPSGLAQAWQRSGTAIRFPCYGRAAPCSGGFVSKMSGLQPAWRSTSGVESTSLLVTMGWGRAFSWTRRGGH